MDLSCTKTHRTRDMKLQRHSSADTVTDASVQLIIMTFNNCTFENLLKTCWNLKNSCQEITEIGAVNDAKDLYFIAQCATTDDYLPERISKDNPRHTAECSNYTLSYSMLLMSVCLALGIHRPVSSNFVKRYRCGTACCRNTFSVIRQKTTSDLSAVHNKM